MRDGHGYPAWIGFFGRIAWSAGARLGLLLKPTCLVLLLVACSDSVSEPETEDPTAYPTWVILHIISGADQAGVEGSLLGEPVVVQVTDGYGRPIDRLPLRFSIICGEGYLYGGQVPSHTVDVLSNGHGLAQVNWKLGPFPDHVLKVTLPPETDPMAPTFRGMPTYVFAGMNTAMSLQWIQGLEFRAGSEVFYHDDRILETPHFLVFSDGSSDDAKIILAAMAEEALHEILELFGISDAGELGFEETEPSTKLTIYSNKTLQYTQMSFAFMFGFVSVGVDAGGSSSVRVRYIVKHELTHVFRMLVEGRWSASQGSGYMWYPDVWFDEGLAEHVAGGSRDPIRNVDDMNAWRAHEDHQNPISIRDWEFFPASVIERSNGYEYYPMFDLAVRYLLDEDGLGRDYSDVLAMFLEMELNGAGFWYAFEQHMGISVADYQDAFFDLMSDYLPPS